MGEVSVPEGFPLIVGAKDTELGHAFCMVRQPRGSGGFEAVRKLGFEGVIG